ncbi:MAG: nuclear transport factor 2 family protein [Candidatus Dadabacteria bacterium]|nr:MAG: nuclear transport factor 2 family protein [Candidatus Dadabacteria bacterium]
MAEEMSLEQRLARIEDREAIRELVASYAHAVWRRDADGAAELFAPDGTMDTGDRPPLVGREQIRQEYRRSFSEARFQPFVHNHLIEELSSDSARGTCTLDLRAVIEGRSMIGAGRYEDEYRKLNGRWYFARRRLRLDYLVPLDEGWSGA